MGGWPDSRKLRVIRERSTLGDITVRMIDGYGRHRTGRNAALVAHYGFLSVFPLVAVLTTILGFVLQGSPTLRDRIIDSALAQIPVIGQQISTDPSRLRGNVIILVLGLITSLWAGMRAFLGMQAGIDDAAEIPTERRSNLLMVRVHALIGIGVIGVAQIGAATITGLVGAARIGMFNKVLLVLAAVVVNTSILAASYRWLCSRRQPWRSVMPGACAAGVVYAALQLVGTAVVGRAIANASPVYGTFASVIGLLTWLSLHALVALLGRELNFALKARRAATKAAAVAPADNT